MSSFTARNLSDDELDIEEHTRELQIEIALNILNKALHHQKSKDYKNARLNYDELGRLEIVKSSNIANNPIIVRLKYLHARNRGFLRIHELIESNKHAAKKATEVKDQDEDQDKDQVLDQDDEIEMSVYGEILGSINDLLNAITYAVPDEKTVLLLSSLFNHFGYIRLARLCYELKVNEVGTYTFSQSLLLNESKIIHEYLQLLSSLKLNNTVIYEKLNKTLCRSKFLSIVQNHNRYNWDDLLTENEWHAERRHDDLVVTLDVDLIGEREVDVNRFWDAWSGILGKPKGKNKYPDAYVFSDEKIKNVKVNFGHVEVLVVDDKNGDQEEEREEERDKGEREEAEKDENDEGEKDENKDENKEESKDESKDENKTYNDDTIAKDGNEEPTPDGDITQNFKDEGNIEDKTKMEDDSTEKISTLSKATLSQNDNNSIDESTESSAEKEKFEDALESIPSTSPQIAQIHQQPQQTSRPIRNLRGKVEAAENTDAILEEARNLDVFVSNILPDVLTHLDIKVDVEPLLSGVIDNDASKFTIPLIQKFYSYIANWDDDAVQALLIMDHSKNNKVNSINELLNIQSRKTVSTKSFTEVSTLGLYDLLDSLSNSNLHFNIMRTKILEFFVAVDESNNYNSVITTRKFNKKSIKTFKILVDSLSIAYYKQIQNDLLYKSKNTESQLNIAISILESLIDSYLEFINDQKLKKSALKTFNDILFFQTTIVKRITLWIDLIEDCFTLNPAATHLQKFLWSKFKWLHIAYIQANAANIDSKQLIGWLADMKDIFETKKYYQPFINYEFISVLNYKSIENEYSKLKILEIFNRNDKSNEILESILLGVENKDENPEIKQQLTTFIENSNLQRKLRLWSLLLRYYQVNSNLGNYKKSYEKIIFILMDELASTRNLNAEDAKVKVLNIIGFFTFFTKQFIEFFCEGKNIEQLTENDLAVSKTMVASASSLLHLFYIMLIYQKFIKIDNRSKNLYKSNKSTELLNDAISCCFFLVSCYISNIESKSKPELVNDLLSMCHVHLGLRNRCSSLNGNFLKFIQFKLSKFEFSISANDVFQIIHCRFGFPVSLDKFETFDHKCKPKKLDLSDAIQLSDYIATYCFKGKHPIQSAPKNDIKSIIDSVIEVVASAGTKNPEMLKNQNIFETYLNETNIDLQFIVKVFNGEYQLEFETPEFTGIEVAQSGLFYLEGLVGINFFKIRKRTVQSRVSELESVSKILKRDVYCGCNRFETWVALGQIYSYIVEDDLIWTADKLNSVERKQATAMSQRKSLLCYLMAISIYVKADDAKKEKYKPVLNTLWNAFAKELYSAWMQPMNKKAFHTFQTIKTNESNKAVDSIVSLPNNIPDIAILKLLELAFKNAIKYDEKNWYDYMYLSKSKHKLKKQPDIGSRTIEVIDLMIKSCILAYEQSNKDDPIIEPHYHLFSMINKAHNENYVSTTQAIDFFTRDPLFENTFETDSPSMSFTQIVIKVLNKLINYDKKNWQHRPVYRLAKVYCEVFKDIESAKKEMLTLINLKPSVRSLSTIWKPSVERSGKHFIYNAIYTKFLVEILYKMGDVYSLIVLLKKIRRAGVIMVNLTKTFDDMTLRICTLIKKSTKLENGYLEDILNRVNYKDFIKYSPQFINYMKSCEKFDDNKLLLKLFFLSETQTFRKLATGFGATSLIDEVFHSIYMKLFVPYLLKALLQERNEGLTLSEILEKAKNFKVEKILSEHKTRTNTPESTQIPQFTESPPENTMDVDIGGIESDLKEADKNSILTYLSSKPILNYPTKDKIKMARRDVSPFAVKLILATAKAVDGLREETNDGELIDYELTGKLDDEELKKVASQLNSKETKENKEEKEFERLISEHERFFEDNELTEFNDILQKFDVKKLVYYAEPKKVEKVSETISEKDIEKIQKTSTLDVETDGVKADTQMANSVAVESSNQHADNGPDANDEVNAYNDENQMEENQKAENQKSELVGAEMRQAEDQNNDIPGNDIPRNDILTDIQKDDVKTNSIQMEGFNKENQTDDDQTDDKFEDAHEEPVDAFTLFTSVQSNSNSQTPSLNNDPFNDNDKVLDADTSKTEPFKINDTALNPVQTKSNSSDSCETTLESKEYKFESKLGKSPSSTKQSTITRFFKVSPEKLSSTVKRPTEEIKVEGSPLSKKRKLIDPEEDYERYKQSVKSDPQESFFTLKGRKSSEPATSRRNSRRQIGDLDLVELGKSGAPRRQRDLKKRNAEVVEVSSDSEGNGDSVIVID